MALYTNTFKFREPYQVIADSEFVKAIAKQKLEVVARLEGVLGGTVKPMITQCCISRLYSSGPEAQSAVNLAKTFERRKCNHWQTKDTDDECIAGIVGDDNRFRYVVATQSVGLRKTLRKVPGVPLVFEKRAVVLLEPASDASVGRRTEVEESKLHVPASEFLSMQPSTSNSASTSNQPLPTSLETASTLPAATRSTGPSMPNTAEQMLAKRKRKRAQEPNPLSQKKKKSDTSAKGGKPKSQEKGKAKAAGEAKPEKKEKVLNKEENKPKAATAEDVGKKQADPTKGISRPEGPGTSKKALKRKQQREKKEAENMSNPPPATTEA